MSQLSVFRRGALFALLAIIACTDETEVQVAAGAADAKAAGPDAAASTGIAALHPGLRTDSIPLVLGKGTVLPPQPADTIRVRFGHRARLVVSPNHLYWLLLYRSAPVAFDAPVDLSLDVPVLYDAMAVVLVGWDEYRKQVPNLQLPNVEAFLVTPPKP